MRCRALDLIFSSFRNSAKKGTINNDSDIWVLISEDRFAGSG